MSISFLQVAQGRDGEKNSPRLTRSAKKKRRSDLPPLANSFKENVESDSEVRGCKVVLNFSPPNQEENRIREAENLQRKESARADRVKRAKENKQLLLFSPKSGRPLQSFDDDEKRKTIDDKQLEDEKPVEGIQVSKTTDNEGNVGQNLDLLGAQNEAYESLQTKLDMLLESKSFDESANMYKEKLISMETQKKHIDGVNQKLEKKVDDLENERKDLQSQIINMKDQILVTTTKLESETAAAKDEATKAAEEYKRIITGFEESKAQMLLEKVRMESEINSLRKENEIRLEGLGTSRKEMEQEREKQALRVAQLESEIFQMKEKAIENLAKISKLESEKETLQGSKLNLEKEVKNLEKDNHSLQNKIIGHEKLISMQKHEADSQYQDLLMQFERKAESNEKVENELEDCKKQIFSMQEALDSMRTDKEEERLNFQKLNEESTKAFANMEQQSAKKNEQIEELSRELEAISTDLENEQEKSRCLEKKLAENDEANEQLKRMEEAMNKEFEDLASDLEKEQKNRRSVEKKLKTTEGTLTNTIEQLKIELETVEHKLDLTAAEKNMIQDQLEEEKTRNKKLLCDRDEALNSHSQASSIIEKKEMDINMMNTDLESCQTKLKEVELQLCKTETTLEAVQIQRDDALKRMETFDERENDLFLQLRSSDRIRRELHNKVMQLSGNIRVYVRVRPELPFEQDGGEKTKPSDSRKRKHDRIESYKTPFKFPGIFDKESKGGQDLCKNFVEMIEPPKDRGGLKQRTKKWQFGFDNVFTPTHGQDEVWEATEPLVQSAIDGYNVCIFAYGQTGSGKTYTMLGDKSNQGIVFRAVQKIFSAKKETETLSKGKTTVSLSLELLEIYNENVRDLLAGGEKQKLKVTSNEVVGSKIVPATSSDQVMEVLELAQSRRCVKATRSNAESSRSHMVFTIHYKVSSPDSGANMKGKLHICDLAGSERLNKSGANTTGDGSLLKETQNINSSLSTLSNVIERLQQGSANIPFRESKLTMLLQNSLGGNSKTLAIVCCNPSSSHFHESLCSLRFADKVNRVELKATSNFSC